MSLRGSSGLLCNTSGHVTLTALAQDHVLLAATVWDRERHYGSIGEKVAKIARSLKTYFTAGRPLYRLSTMSNDGPRMTGPTLKVVGELMSPTLLGVSGADISKSTGIPSGTLYPILFRLEKAGWLSSEWEEGEASNLGRPRKRLYKMTALGKYEGKAAFDNLLPSGGRLVWQS